MVRQGLTKNNIQLRTCKPLSHTLMLPKSKPQCLLGATLAVHVKSIWIGEDVFVPVGRLVGGDDAFAGFDELR